MSERLESQKMGVLPEGKLLLSMAVPIMLSMLVPALYNIVDSMYVSRVSEDCLTALSLAFPAQNIMIGLAPVPGWVSPLWSPGPWARGRTGGPTRCRETPSS